MSSSSASPLFLFSVLWLNGNIWGRDSWPHEAFGRKAEILIIRKQMKNKSRDCLAREEDLQRGGREDIEWSFSCFTFSQSVSPSYNMWGYREKHSILYLQALLRCLDHVSELRANRREAENWHSRPFLLSFLILPGNLFSVKQSGQFSL